MRKKRCKWTLKFIFASVAVMFLLGIIGIIGTVKTQAAEILDSGTCGKNLTWVIDGEGVLTISGEGNITDYSSSYPPWYYLGSGIKKVVIDKGVTSIGNHAFFDCYKLTSITIPEGVTSIGDGAFSGCSGLTSITISKGVTSIGEWAFSYCRGLTSIEIPSSVTSIGGYAFIECSGLTSITIPSSVTSIGNDAFSYCNGLKDVYYTGTEQAKNEITIGVPNVRLINANWHFPATVIFKVRNGSWNDGTTLDRTITLTEYEDGSLKLKSSDIPAVGNKPFDTYKAGSWDVDPSMTTAITGDTTFTYTYYVKDAVKELNNDSEFVKFTTNYAWRSLMWSMPNYSNTMKASNLLRLIVSFADMMGLSEYYPEAVGEVLGNINGNYYGRAINEQGLREYAKNYFNISDSAFNSFINECKESGYYYKNGVIACGPVGWGTFEVILCGIKSASCNGNLYTIDLYGRSPDEYRMSGFAWGKTLSELDPAYTSIYHAVMEKKEVDGKTCWSLHSMSCESVKADASNLGSHKTHKWNNGTITTAATCTKTGVKTFTCSFCGQKTTAAINKLTPTIKLSVSKKTIKKKKSFTLTISKLAKGDSIKSVKSGKKKIATVKKLKGNKYKITGKKKGKAVITVTLKSGKTAKCKVTVK